MAIPKVIHYCWFGGSSLPPLAKKCIESWEKYCPDYEIIRWDESNFDIKCNLFAEQAYNAKKWAFVSDVVRMYALYNYGGVYMDTDVELLKSIDDMLTHNAFSGFESSCEIPTGIMACEKNNELFREFLDYYSDKKFIREDGSYDITTNVIIITEIMKKYGVALNNSFQTVNGFTLYPSEFFCPKDFKSGIINLTKNTHCIHHFNGSWQTKKEKRKWYVRHRCIAFFGETMGVKLYRGIELIQNTPSILKSSLAKRGIKGTIRKLFDFLKNSNLF